MRTIKFGGQLERGDFIAISYSNYIQFGWYVGDGKGGTIQFYNYSAPNSLALRYAKYLTITNPTKWEMSRYKDGLSLKGIYKDFIYDTSPHRVCKVNPMDIFTDPEERETFEKSEDVLIKLNFIK